MLSHTNFFRTAVRGAPRLRPDGTRTIGASTSRLFSSPSTVRNAEQTQPPSGNNSELYSSLDNAQRTLSGRSTAKPMGEYVPFKNFITPFDFAAKARVKKQIIRRTPPKVGPSRAEAESRDIFRQLDIDPVKEALNTTLLSNFVTEMGKIKGRAVTGLTWRSQRRLGKAIRRAKMMGVIPVLSRRPLRNLDQGFNT